MHECHVCIHPSPVLWCYRALFVVLLVDMVGQKKWTNVHMFQNGVQQGTAQTWTVAFGIQDRAMNSRSFIPNLPPRTAK